MKSYVVKAFLFDAYGEEDVEEGTDIQPSDPGKVSFSSDSNAADGIRVWKVVTFCL
jgi:hypothetical protein